MLKLKDKKRVKAIWIYDIWQANCPYCNFINQGNVNLLCVKEYCNHYYLGNQSKNIVYFYKPKKRG